MAGTLSTWFVFIILAEPAGWATLPCVPEGRRGLRGASDQRPPLIRELNHQDFIHKHDPTVVELRVIPTEHPKTLAHYGAEPGLLHPG